MCYSNKLNFGQNWVQELRLMAANDNVLFSKPFMRSCHGTCRGQPKVLVLQSLQGHVETLEWVT